MGRASRATLAGFDRARLLGWLDHHWCALSLVAFFVVPPIKGEPIPALWPRFLAALLVNAAWGLGTALFLKLAPTTRGYLSYPPIKRD
jgi:hypothetical protein